jgi:two-component system, OmpR family, copper resistance phosphate regulon response regulator CusR
VKILVVEDEPVAAAYLKRGLSEEGYAAYVAPKAKAAKELVAVFAYDLILLDVSLPIQDVFSLCQQWRSEAIQTPILFLTARDDIADRVTGLNQGGDDYRVKPFAFEELLARIRALLRRVVVLPYH